MQSLPFGNARKLKKPVDTPTLRAVFGLIKGYKGDESLKLVEYLSHPFPARILISKESKEFQGVPRRSQVVSRRSQAEVLCSSNAQCASEPQRDAGGGLR